MEWKLNIKKKNHKPPVFFLRRINIIGINYSFTKEQFFDKINVFKERNKSKYIFSIIAGFSMMQDCCV